MAGDLAGKLEAVLERVWGEVEGEVKKVLEEHERERQGCSGRGGRCERHGKPKGPDLQCEVGRGGPLVLPEPTAQRSTKKTTTMRRK